MYDMTMPYSEMPIYRIAKQQWITPRYVRLLRTSYQDVPAYQVEKMRMLTCGENLASRLRSSLCAEAMQKSALYDFLKDYGEGRV